MPLVKAGCSVDKCKQQFWLQELLDLNWCKQQSINFICASSRINDAPSAAQETSLDTGRTGLLSEACSSAVASCSAPSAPPHSCKEKRHWSKEHSSPPSSTETLLSPSLNHDLAPSFPRRMFPLWACSCHDTVQRRVAVVPSNATGTPKTWGLSLVTWNMPCSQDCTVLFLLHFVLSLAAGHEGLSVSGSLLSFFAEQGQCAVVQFCAWPD